jgi:putative ABC transport system permease protein
MRNLFSDRLRFIAALAGVSFAVILMAGQMAIYLGASRLITSMIDHARADIWIMPKGCQSFEDGLPLLRETDRSLALSVPGVESVVPLVVVFADWLRTDGGINSVVLVGAEPGSGGPEPWNLTSSYDRQLAPADDVIVDRGYLDDLGVRGAGDHATIGSTRVRIGALSDGVRSFTQSPYVFARPAQTRRFIGADPGSASYLLVKLAPDRDVTTVQDTLRQRFAGAEVLTTSEFRQRSLDRWLMESGAGLALVAGTILSAIIAIAIMAETLNTSIRDHETEFAVLRSMGSTIGYLRSVVLIQAATVAFTGYVIGLPCILFLVRASALTPLPMILTPSLVAVVLFVTFGLGLVSALGSLMRVQNLDPIVLMK